MADTVEMKIYQALVIAAQAMTLPNNVILVLPGMPFIPSAPSKFVSVEVHFNRSIETDLSLDMDPIRQGFMRANVMWPKSSPVVDGIDLAGLIRQQFRRGTKLYQEPVSVRIDEDPEIGVMFPGTTHWTIPVTVRWVSYP